MYVWLVKLGEPLPIDGPVRLHRYGILAEELANRDHDVLYWTSTFNHQLKRQRNYQDEKIIINDNYQIDLIFAKEYRKNLSIDRILHHRKVAKSFKKKIYSEKKPDIILVSFPIANMAKVVIPYAKENNIPVIIDIRDLWPDVFLKMIPGILRWIFRILLLPMFIMNKHIFRNATALIAVSSEYLKWGLKYAGRGSTQLDKIFYIGYQQDVILKKKIEEAKCDLENRGIDKKKIICCFIGTFGLTYDLGTIIKAAKILEKNGDDRYQFVFCGDGEKSEEWKKLSNGLSNVLFLGWVNNATIKVLIHSVDIGLVCYTKTATQSLPNKPFEYLSGGLPILSSLRGDLEFILSKYNCGYTYQAGNPNDFINVLYEITSDPEKRITMSKNAINLYEKEFSAKKIHSSLIKYLEEIKDNKI